MATLDHELETHIIRSRPKPGRPRIKAAEPSGLGNPDLEVSEEADPGYVARNVELILDHYGMGSMFWPTLQELADAYEGLGTRERARQIINSYYGSLVPDTPLPAAREAASLLESRSIWLESEFLEAIKQAGLTRGIDYAAGLLDYLKTQGLAEDYNLYRPDLKKVTRATYFDHGDRVIVNASRLSQLRTTFSRARRIVGLNGHCRLDHIDGSRPPSDLSTVRRLIQIHSQAWSTEHDGEFWYTFEDRENRLVNSAEKIFSLIETCDINLLANLLYNSLLSRTSRFKEYPDAALIREWLSHSDHFLVNGNEVTLSGENANLTDIEGAVVEIMRGHGAMSSPDITEALSERGYGSAYIQKQIFSSALVHVDRTGGRGHYRFTLVTDLRAPHSTPSEDTDYEHFKSRLQALEKTNVPRETQQRSEQRILSEWIFRSSAQCACAICGRPFSTSSLVTAHKKKRSICTETEKRDPYIVFPLCLFGCDHLYEHNFIGVKDGVVIPGQAAPGPTEAETMKNLVGRPLDPRWTAGPAFYFDNVLLDCS